MGALTSITNKEVEDTRERAAKAELETIRLRAAIADRDITPDQQRKIREALAKFIGEFVYIRSYPNDPEASRLIVELKAALEPNIHVEDRTGELAGASSPVLGIRIQHTDKGRAFAETLVKTFHNDGGLAVEPISPYGDVNVTEILVGLKPVALARETAKIAERIETRRLDSEARNRIVSKLRGFSGQKINLFGYDPDPEIPFIANDVLVAIDDRPGAAGWAVTVSSGNIAVGWTRDIEVLIKPDADESSKEAAKSLASALRSEHLTVRGPRPISDHTPPVVKETVRGQINPNNPITIVIGRIR